MLGVCSCVLILLLFSCSPVLAFGAGDIPDFAYLEGKAFRHGDIEAVLSELAKKAGGASILAAIGIGGKFGGLDIKRVYFGNWLRDYSQAMDVAGLSKLSAQAILNLVMALGFLAHGYATGEFEVTFERLGVYLPVEHIDNPKDYNDNKDARHVEQRLRGPVNPQELEVDPQTGMKNYIANERGNWDTSSACVRRTMMKCIELGRRARRSGGSSDTYEAYRLLGTFLHTLEDFTAHSNYCELVLQKLGHRQIFVHVGDNVKVNSPSGSVAPLVTGTFGSADFLHSLLGESSDHLSEASVTDLSKAIDRAKSQPDDASADGLRKLIFELPGSQGQTLSREMDSVRDMNTGFKAPMDMTPEELHRNLWQILTFRDNVAKYIANTIERIPGLSSLVERLTNAINKFIFLQLEPFVRPIMQQATGALQTGSAAVVNNADQFKVFDDAYASDPTHSFLSKDHFACILNEPAGLVAQVVVRHVVTAVVKAWDNDSIDPRSVIDDALTVFHHPHFGARAPLQQQMFSCMQRWFEEQPDKQYVLNALSKNAVRNHKNTRKGTTGHNEHQYQSMLPTPQQMYQQASSAVTGQAQHYAQQIPGYSTYHNMTSRDIDSSNAQGNYESASYENNPSQSIVSPSYPTESSGGYGPPVDNLMQTRLPAIPFQSVQLELLECIPKNPPAAMNGNHFTPPFQPTEARPKNVGIHAIELYFPSRCVSQVDLEKFDGVSEGKYTVGLGQEFMAFVDDREDIHSLLLSVTASLLKKYNIDPRAIGRIDVGTESIIDKAKAAKTVLMDLFAPSGNTDIEGIDAKNACYGGTAALFNCVNWIESSSWDGRYALVVTGDVAVYAEGPARPAGGAGAAALLIGPDAPLVLEPGRSTYMANSWDFYKPALASEYPEVDGPLTLVAYFNALQEVYDLFKQKSKTHESLHDFDYVCFHGPFGKQVQKAFARMTYIDFLSNPSSPRFSAVNKQLAAKPAKETLADKELEKSFMASSKPAYKEKVWPGTASMRRLGNTYTASLYGCLASLVDSQGASLQGKRIGMFSYGSGLASSFFSIIVRGDCSRIQKELDLTARFAAMQVVSCDQLVTALNLREEKHNIKDYVPAGSIDNVPSGAYYLDSCDHKARRKYAIAK